MRARAVIVVMAVVGLIGAGGPAAATARSSEQHCVIEVTGRRPNGELRTSAPRCYGDRGQARQSVGVASTIAIHYDGLNFTGSSITISGSDCLGGWLNLTVAWRNRISSSSNFCPVVRFYDGLNLTGAVQVMTSSGNLGSLNNRADSIQYSS